MEICAERAGASMHFGTPVALLLERKEKSPGIAPRAFSLRILVRLAGIEPTTPWFVAKYSIQLSYSRAGKHYSSFVSIPEARISRFPLQQRPCPPGLPPEERAL
jgi:hypothetical protein